MGVLTRARAGTAEREAWPVAARVAAGLLCPGGTHLLERAVEGAGIDEGSRVVELQAGLGLAGRHLVARGVRAWTGVEDDPLAVEHLRRAVGGAGARVVAARPSASGLDDACAGAVLVDGAVAERTDEEAAALLAEAVRLLRPAGRLALTALVPGAGAEDPAGRAALAALAAQRVRVRDLAALREMVEAAGLVVVGSTDAPLHVEPPLDLARMVGPRLGMRFAREAADETVRRAATSTRQAIEAASPHLRAGLVVAERPLVLGLRRPR
ncbi:MAG: methyltransferase domain-containing protein [Miltoncostaeaceae bacterium]